MATWRGSREACPDLVSFPWERITCMWLKITAAAVVLASAALVNGYAQEAPHATRETIRSLKQGGYVLYMRHAASDTSKPDRAPDVDLRDCATQRPLSDK